MASSLDKFAPHCQICLEDLVGRDPRALQCLHTFCFQCLERLPIENVIPRGRELCGECDTNVTGNRKNWGKRWCPTCNGYRDKSYYNGRAFAYDAISCPTCKKKTRLPEEGVNGLPANFLMNEISDILREANVTQRCQYCKGQSVICFCENCMFFMCETCKGKHNEVKLFGGHIQRSLDARKNCELHDNKAMYFCQECKVPICVNCVLSQAHHTHSDDILEYPTWAKSKLNNISIRNDRLKQTIDNTECQLDEMLKINKNYCETILSIDKAASIFKKAINDQAETMIKKVYETKKKQEVATETMRRAVEDYRVFSSGFASLTEKSEASEVFEIESKLSLAEKSTHEIPNLGMKVSYQFSPGPPVPAIGTLEVSLGEGSRNELFKLECNDNITPNITPVEASISLILGDDHNDRKGSFLDASSDAVESGRSQNGNCNSRKRRHSDSEKLVQQDHGLLQHSVPMPFSGLDTRPKSE